MSTKRSTKNFALADILRSRLVEWLWYSGNLLKLAAAVELMEIECMSKIEIAYLKALRKHGFDPDAPIPGIEAVTGAVLDKLRAAGAPENIIEQLVEMQPKTLKEQYDLVLKPIQHDVMADAALLRASWKGDILVGGVPTNTCNASAQKVDGGYLVLVNSGMIQLLHQLAKVFVSSAHLVMVAYGDEEVPMALADRLAFMPSDWTKEDALTAVTEIYRCLQADNSDLRETASDPPAISSTRP